MLRVFTHLAKKIAIPVYSLFVRPEKFNGILIEGGEFRAGEHKDKVFVASFYLSLHPVTNRQYGRFLRSTGYPAPSIRNKTIWLGNTYPEQLADHPVVGVSWFDAVAYCDWAGLRLPTSLEWEKAARGYDGRLFPWGDDWGGGQHCRWSGNRGEGMTCDIFAYRDGASPYGIPQMAGNVYEWCADDYAPERELIHSRPLKIIKGGCWTGYSPGFFFTHHYATALPDYADLTIGFRCACDSTELLE